MMTASSFIGNWNIFQASKQEEKFTVASNTGQITIREDGILKLDVGGMSFGLFLTEGSGYSGATGSTANAMGNNYLILTLSQDGNTFNGAFRFSETSTPEAWWATRQ